MNLTDRLNSFVDIGFGGKKSALAAALGWKAPSVYKYLSGELKPGRSVLEQIEKIGGNADWLVFGRGDMFANNEAGRALREKVQGTPAPTVATRAVKTPKRQPTHHSPPLIPLFLVPVSAGFPTPGADDYIERWIGFEDLIAPIAENVFAVRANGRSMCYDGLMTGDILFVDRVVEPEAGNVVVATVNGELCVKRLEVIRDTLFLMPSNDEFLPVEVTPQVELRIWGVVTGAYHPIK